MNMNEIQQERERGTGNKDISVTQPDQSKASEKEREYIEDIPQGAQKRRKDKLPPFASRIRKEAAVLMIAGCVALAAALMNSTDTGTGTGKGTAIEQAVETHMSTTLAAGTVLMSEDDHYVGGDMTITHSSDDDETTVWVWDYAAEDGDYVQVFVDGAPLGDPFMIKNEPVSLKVPSVGDIKVVGTRDGGGGITYGVYYELNKTTYFNGMDVGGSNVYTLVRE